MSKEDEQKIIDLLKKLSDNFYGKLTINIQNGKIVNCTKEESFKI